jgi:predicted Abi (CAAX) family protease
VQVPAADISRILSGVFALRGEAFADALHQPYVAYLALAVVLGGGFSEAVGQSVVLFANRVKPARFAFSVIVNGLLFAFGYVFLLLSTWLIMAIPGRSHVPLPLLAVVFALSYAPVLFAFLSALPYCGLTILWGLRIWHLCAMVTGVAVIAHDSAIDELTDVGLGWLFLAIAQQTFGKPVAKLGEWLLSATAGVDISDNEQLLVNRLDDERAPTVSAGAGAPSGGAGNPSTGLPRHSNGWKTALSSAAVVALCVVVSITLRPVHGALFGWESHVPRAARVPLDLGWIALVGVIVAGFMAPVETLGWWAGWYGDDLFTKSGDATVSADGEPGRVARYVVYLDGISQSSSKYMPDIETFLDALAPRLPSDTRLVRGIMTYSVLNRPLDDDPVFSRFWRFVDSVRGKNPTSLLGMIVNLRNVLIVAVSADQRYGPLYNYGIAQLVYDGLMHAGYRPNSGTPVTLIGYSGGGQMSAGSASFLRRALEAPIEVISLGGVISGSAQLLELEHLYHFHGTKDNVERLGPIMFASRWKISALSNWNRALRLGRVSIHSLGPVGHQVPGGMFDPIAKLPDGRTFLEQTLQCIASVLDGTLVLEAPPVPQVPSNYAAYVKAAWNRLDYYPIDAEPDANLYHPVGEWMGRLILPSEAQRQQIKGALFEVHRAPAPHAALKGRVVALRWSEDPIVRQLVRAVTQDVHFGSRAAQTSKRGGLIQPYRLDGRRLVGPLESLAGSRPIDDMLVMLAGPVGVEPGRDPILRVNRQPVQIAARWYGLVQIAAPPNGESLDVIHFNRETRAFDGPRETFSVPEPVADLNGLPTSTLRGLDTSELNDLGWYAYGMPDANGRFVLRALAPRALLGMHAQTVKAPADAHHYVKHDAWNEVVAHKGGILSTRFDGHDWRAGDNALIVHTYGGVGGQRAEASAKGPVYFGHFAFGFADVVDDPLALEPRFEIVYEQVYTHNGDGLIAGALHWSRYLGDRQFGWIGLRPTCDVLLKLDAITPQARTALMQQLDAMTARYRIGDGTGGTYVGAASNCAQDSNRALFGALRAIDALPKRRWGKRRKTNEPVLVALARDLRDRLQPFGAPRPDWAENRFDLGSTMEDEPIDQLRMALGSWRVMLPRLAWDTVSAAFFRHGAHAWILGTSQLGDRPEIEPVAPMTLPFID